MRFSSSCGLQYRLRSGARIDLSVEPTVLDSVNILSANEISKHQADQVLFDHLTIGLTAGEKVGLIGRNGQGKSTLARILAGIEEPDSGTVTFRKNLKIAYMQQNPAADSNLTIKQYLLQDGELPAGQVREVLSLVGIESDDKKLSELSGGGIRRASLARALLAEADLLFLDEPTNHLDLDAVVSLEKRLKKFSGALVLITHDRYFLDRIVSSIFELDQGVVQKFTGGYGDYLEQKEAQQDLARIAEQKARQFLVKEREWLRRQPKARGTKQQARIDRIEVVENRDKFAEKKQMKFAATSERLGKKILEIKDLSACIGERTLFKDFSYKFQDRDRIGILGPNGCGKTTLLNILSGRFDATSGRIDAGETLKIGYFDQMNLQLDNEMTVDQYFKSEVGNHSIGSGLSPKELLAAFLFHSSVLYRPIGKLSGGEKRRIYLVSILLKRPNFLILDEPTNDFDIATLTALESFLDDFTGPVITVSHDRWFLDRIADHLFLFQPDATIQDYIGSASDYIVDREDFSKLADYSEKQPGQPEKKAPKTKTLNNKERKELNDLPGRIENLEKEIAELEKKLSQGTGSPEELAEWGKRHVSATSELEHSMERWVELEEIANG